METIKITNQNIRCELCENIATCVHNMQFLCDLHLELTLKHELSTETNELLHKEVNELLLQDALTKAEANATIEVVEYVEPKQAWSWRRVFK